MLLNIPYPHAAGHSYTYGIFFVIGFLILLLISITFFSIRWAKNEEDKRFLKVQNEDANKYDSVPPENYMAWAILTTIFCCLPFGIVGIVKSSSVNAAWRAGFKEEAIRKSISAKIWCQLGTFIPLALMVLYLIVFAIIHQK